MGNTASRMKIVYAKPDQVVAAEVLNSSLQAHSVQHSLQINSLDGVPLLKAILNSVGEDKLFTAYYLVRMHGPGYSFMIVKSRTKKWVDNYLEGGGGGGGGNASIELADGQLTPTECLMHMHTQPHLLMGHLMARVNSILLTHLQSLVCQGVHALHEQVLRTTFHVLTRSLAFCFGRQRATPMQLCSLATQIHADVLRVLSLAYNLFYIDFERIDWIEYYRFELRHHVDPQLCDRIMHPSQWKNFCKKTASPKDEEKRTIYLHDGRKLVTATVKQAESGTAHVTNADATSWHTLTAKCCVDLVVQPEDANYVCSTLPEVRQPSSRATAPDKQANHISFKDLKDDKEIDNVIIENVVNKLKAEGKQIEDYSVVIQSMPAIKRHPIYKLDQVPKGKVIFDLCDCLFKSFFDKREECSKCFGQDEPPKMTIKLAQVPRASPTEWQRTCDAPASTISFTSAFTEDDDYESDDADGDAQLD